MILDFKKFIIDIEFGIFDSIKHFLFFKIKKPFWNRKLIKNTKGVYVPWDICESLVAYTFAQFELFYARYAQVFDAYQYLQTDLETNRHAWNKEKINEYELSILYKKQISLEAASIYRYVTMHRKNNSALADSLLEEKYKHSKIVLEKSDDCTFHMVETGVVKNLQIQWEVTEEGEIKLTNTQVVATAEEDDFDKLAFSVEELNSIFAKKIIEIRNYCWD